MRNIGRTRLRQIFLVAVFLIGLSLAFTAGTVTGVMARPAIAADKPAQFTIFWEVWDLVERYFVDRDKVDYTLMTYGAITGMLSALGDDNHTMFFSPEAAAQQTSAMEGSFEGIGAYVEDRDGFVRIVAPIHGSPAEKAGILPGDILLKVDGEDVIGKPSWEVVTRIRGEAGTTVVLTVLHPDADEPVDIEVTRDTIDEASVSWARIPGTDFVYLQVTQFAADTGEELEQTLDSIQAELDAGRPIEGIVLDLRNNPGGYVPQVVRLNSALLPEGEVIFQQRDASGETITYKSVGRHELLRDIPMIALINQGTASGGEITAGALQENGRARLVGQPTFGTGTVLQGFELSDGSLVRIGIANWLTPNGNLIKNQGVKPDVSLEQDATVRLVDSFTLDGITLTDLLNLGDKQFNLALLQLRLLVK